MSVQLPVNHREVKDAKYHWGAAAATMGAILSLSFVMILFAVNQSKATPERSLAWLTIEPAFQETAQPSTPAIASADIRQIAVERGDTLTSLLVDAGADPTQAMAATNAIQSVYDPSQLRGGQIITVTFDRLPPGATPTDPAPAPDGPAGGAEEFEALPPKTFPSLLAIAISPSAERYILVERNPDMTYRAQEIIKPLKATDARARGAIVGNLYASARNAGVPDNVIADLIRLYSHVVDFQREVREGDTFDVLYTNYTDDAGQSVKGGDIAYVELVLAGSKKQLYRFTTQGDQYTDYFTPEGISGKRLLMRTPIDGAKLSSGFGLRKHPVLGFTKMHKGIDFAAPAGTPIVAAGSGIVDFAAWRGGYGRYVRLRHSEQYSTAYAHLSRFAHGLSPGDKVRQGQIIGYVGTSGQSTGPHLHYEVFVGSQQISPTDIKIPTGRALEGNDLARFEDHVSRINLALQNWETTPVLVAQLAMTTVNLQQ